MREHFHVLGVKVSAVNMERALQNVDAWVHRRQRRYVCVCPVYTLMSAFYDPAFREVVNGAGMVTPDGMPLVWMGRLLGREDVSRVYGPDLMLAVCELSRRRGYRHYLYGGAEGVATALATTLCHRFPGLQIVGSESPPFGPLSAEEDGAVVDRINDSRADIVWVGLGSPKQDRWMADHLGRLHAPVLIGVGAAFDFLTGRVRQAPAWMRRNGLEWLFRLVQEPRRLWRRYLVYNPLFIYYALLQLSGLKKFPTTAHGRPG